MSTIDVTISNSTTPVQVVAQNQEGITVEVSPGIPMVVEIGAALSVVAVTGRFEATIGDVVSLSVPASLHQINGVKGVTVLNPSRQAIDLLVTIQSDDTVVIECSYSLLNYKLIIF